MMDNPPILRVLLGLLLAFALSVGTLGCTEDVDGQENQGVNQVDPDAGGDDVDPGDTDPADPDAGGNDVDPIDDAGDTTEPPDDVEEDIVEEPDVPEVLPDLTVDAIYPTRGPLPGGTPFVIEGEGFTNDSVVLFGATEVDVDLVGDILSGTTPPGPALGPVTVRVLDDITGEDTLVNGFTYVEQLRLTSVQPSILNVDGGVEISLHGQGFSQDTRVTIGSRPVPQITFLSSSHLRVIAPPNPAGPADVRLTDLHASFLSPNAVTYVMPARIDSVSPPVGSTTGGDTITLTGAGFEDGMDVLFGGVAASSVNVTADGQEATAITPPNSAGIVHVQIITSDDGAILANGFAYLGQGGGDPAIDAVFPAYGSTSGGEEVYIVGQFDDGATPQVYFGGQAAAVLDNEAEMIRVLSPSSAAGAVDVIVEYGALSLTASDAFTYFDELFIDDLSPSQGDVSGGTSVTVTGTGFTDVTTVSLGGLNVNFNVVDDETITFTTPASSSGPADLLIRADGNRSDLLEEAFFYTADLELWSHTPTRGSTAGNTYVELRGRGFTENTEVFFAGIPAAEVTVLDAYNLALRTPPHSSASVEITATDGAQDALAPEPYTYFNPGAVTGGTWGNPIDGAVNVIVFAHQGGPVENALVMLSTNANTPYAGLTDVNGMITLSGPDVLGEQTITATADGHSSATVQRVDAENITIFLYPEADGDGVFPPPPPSATFTGTIQGLDKIDRPSGDEMLMAIVYSTRPSLRARIPDPGAENVTFEDGPYTITTRVGELGLVALGGIYNTQDQSFTPSWLGVARNLTAADGQTYQVDIELEYALNETINLKFNDPPLNDPGPDTNRALLYLDLGVDGIFGPMEEYSTTSEIIELERIAPLVGSLSDASYTIIASSDDSGFLPYSETTLRYIDDLNQLHITEPMTSTVRFITPQSGGSLQNGLVQWQLDGINTPDLYYVFIETAMGAVIWEAFVDGSETSFVFPTFPNFSQFGLPNSMNPYPPGSYYLVHVGINADGLSGSNYSYDNLGINSFRAYAVHQIIINL